MCVCVCWDVGMGMCTEVRGQLVGLSSVLVLELELVVRFGQKHLSSWVISLAHNTFYF